MSADLEWLYGLEQFGIKFGLDHITAIVEALGRPERAFRSVHVAGTNGKGSVTAMVESALCAAGHASARYTSPHLLDLSERFVIEGRPVAPEALHRAVGDVRRSVERLRESGRLEVHPTFFEVTTAVAFELFRRAGVEIAVCEVGLGGRLDATNVLNPLVTAITTIDFDHEQYLGHTLRDIAIEKAGIIKPGVPVVVGRVDSEAFAAIASVARARGAPLVDASTSAAGDIVVGLRGAHQIENAVVALKVLEVLNERGVVVPPPAIADGLAGVSWPGRLDLRRLADGREALLDAAHNAQGAAALAAYLRDSPFAGAPLVFAAMRDKDIDSMLGALAPAIGALVLTSASSPRSADPIELARRARAVAPELPVEVRSSLADALAIAWRMSPRIVVAGSIFLLSDVMKAAGWS